jgi:subtilisin family serine protease
MDPNAITVGEVRIPNVPAFGKPLVSSAESSSGPGTFLRDNSGNLITPISAGKPDISAPSGLPTTASPSNDFNQFYGTSSSTPAAAAVAALMLQENRYRQHEDRGHGRT